MQTGGRTHGRYFWHDKRVEELDVEYVIYLLVVKCKKGVLKDGKKLGGRILDNSPTFSSTSYSSFCFCDIRSLGRRANAMFVTYLE